jgi:GTP-binding protein YchF
MRSKPFTFFYTSANKSERRVFRSGCRREGPERLKTIGVMAAGDVEHPKKQLKENNMGFNCGLVGLPNAGKSTLFNAITRLGVEASAYPFCTIEPHVGRVALEDSRLDIVFGKVGSAKRVPTVLEFVDIAGLVRGASKGEGLGNQFLSHIERVDALAYVIRCFEEPNVSHPYGSLDPVRDAGILTGELILRDMSVVETHLSKARSAAKSGASPARKQIDILESVHHQLEEETEVRKQDLNEFQRGQIRELNLLTAKPVLFVANTDEFHLKDGELLRSLQQFAMDSGALCLPFCAQVEAEIAELDLEDQKDFLRAMGLEQSGLQNLVRAGYEILDLVTFFTANEKEAHAWTVKRNTAVNVAAGRVHSDFQEKFIKAEVIKVSDLKQHGSVKALHDLGLVAVHGKDYKVEDGDLILFRI